MKNIPYKILDIKTYVKHIMVVWQGTNMKKTPTKRKNVLSNLNKCHASVKPTSSVVEKGNLGPSVGSEFLYLFFQDNSGFQKFLFFL